MLLDHYKGVIDESVIGCLLSHPFWTKGAVERYQYQQNIIKTDRLTSDLNDVEKTVSFLSKCFLNGDEQFTEIEYWFQDIGERNGNMAPHCDHDRRIIEDLQRSYGFTPHGEWLRYMDYTHTMSPVTIAVYLDVSPGLIGGDLVISELTWLDQHKPLNKNSNEIFPYESKKVSPDKGDVVVFNGSRYYHWVNKVIHGERKSMLINFWNRQ